MPKYKANNVENQDILIKTTKKKKKNQVLAYFMEHLVSESMHDLVKNCSTFMMLVGDETLEKKKQHKGNSCKNRFCPICSWRKAKKDALALSVMMAYLQEEEQKQFIFLTLTAPNVEADDLNEEIKHYNHSFKKLMERKEVRSVVRGYARKLEITYNKERFITKDMYRKAMAYYDKRGLAVGDNNPSYDTYHPHFHVLLVVDKSYFNNSRLYITRDRWLELWQEVTNNPLITQIDVRKVRGTQNDKVYEIAKYSAKDEDYLVNQDVFEVFYKVLKGKRLIVYSGLFKEAMTLFKEGKLDEYKEKDATTYVYALLYNWGHSEYVEKEKRLLTEEEQKDINGQLFDDMDVDND